VKSKIGDVLHTGEYTGGEAMMSGDSGRYRLLVHSARQLVQVSASGDRRLTGARQMNSLAVLERRRHDGQGLSVVVDRSVSIRPAVSALEQKGRNVSYI